MVMSRMCLGLQFTLYSCIRGMLYEINERLLMHPDLLYKSPEENGYIAFLSPKKHESDNITAHMMDRKQYSLFVVERAAKVAAGDVTVEPTSLSCTLAPKSIVKRSSLCFDFQKGQCQRVSCRFEHTLSETKLI